MEIFTINNVWMMICTALVFFMHLGFGFLEIGLTRKKNTINILFKNIFIITVGLLLYSLAGFNLMYPGFTESSSGFFAFAGWGISPPVDGLTAAYANGGYTWWTDFLFQGVFAATAATIVSGAVAERIKILPFMIFTIIYVGLVYPIAGSWDWGGGFLEQRETPFYDFAGSTLVHSVGGWAAIVAVFILGSRIGKFVNGKSRAIPGHNIPLATAGVLILWLGWFGFNGGSVLSANPATTSLVLVTTCISAATGGVTAAFVTFFKDKNLDLTMFLNCILGGLVGITAGADVMSPMDATLIGGISGIIIVFGVSFIDKIHLDDPVGAIAVHLFCGIWGTLAVGIFGDLAGINQLISQLVGIISYAIICISSSLIIFFTLNKTIGIRVSIKEEIEGLDMHEHGMNAYHE